MTLIDVKRDSVSSRGRHQQNHQSGTCSTCRQLSGGMGRKIKVQQVEAVLAATQRLWFDGLTLPHHQLKSLRSNHRAAHAALKSNPGTLQYHRPRLIIRKQPEKNNVTEN